MFKKIVNVISVIVLVVLVVFVAITFLTRIMGKTPSVFGYYFFRVSSNSMEPELKVGDVILVESVDADEIHKNDIVTYKSESGSTYGREVTHRVVADPYKKNGRLYFQTQGDIPGAQPDKPITYDQIQGKYVRKLTLIGKLYGFIGTPTGIVVFIGIIAVLFGYEMISLMVSYKKIDETDDKLFGVTDKDKSESEGSETNKTDKDKSKKKKPVKEKKKK